MSGRWARDRYPMLSVATMTVRVVGWSIAAVGGAASFAVGVQAGEPFVGLLGLAAAVGFGSVVAVVGTVVDLLADIADYTRSVAEDMHRMSTSTRG